MKRSRLKLLFCILVVLSFLMLLNNSNVAMAGTDLRTFEGFSATAGSSVTSTGYYLGSVTFSADSNHVNFSSASSLFRHTFPGYSGTACSNDESLGDSPTYFQFSSPSNFKLDSFSIMVFDEGNTSQVVDILGYKTGNADPVAEVSAIDLSTSINTSGSDLANGIDYVNRVSDSTNNEYGGNLTFTGSNWGDVDRVVIKAHNGVVIHVAIDGLSISTPPDTTPPSVSSIVRQSPSAAETSADSVTYRVTFNESVSGVNTSDFSLTTTGAVNSTGISSVSAVNGSTYDVTVSGVSGDGTIRLDLNSSGTGIRDTAFNSISGGFAAGEHYTIDNTPPTVFSIMRQSPTAASTSASSITYRVTFNESVSGVDATDFSTVTTGTVSISSVSVPTLTNTTFDVTINSISGDGTIGLDLKSSGTGIKDTALNDISGGFTTGEQYSIDTTAPIVTSIVRQNPSIDTTKEGSATYRVNFSESVIGVDASDFLLTTTGAISATIALPSTVVSSTAIDVTVNSISGNGTIRLDLKSSGTGIRDSFGNSISAGYTTGETYTFDTIAPVVSSVAVPANGAYKAGDVLNFTVNFNETITVTDSGITLGIVIGATPRTAIVQSIASNSITFSYTVVANENDSDGITINAITLNGSEIADSLGNHVSSVVLNNVDSTSNVLVDTTAPTISSISASSGSYIVNNTIDFTVNFSENVTVLGGGLTLGLNVGGNNRTATYVSGSGSTNLVFRYTVQANDLANGVTTGAISLISATLKDVAGNAANLDSTYFISGISIDAVAPTVTTITLPSNKTYKAGDALNFTVAFSENVTVAAGTPRIQLTLSSGTVNATYVSGSGTSVLSFSYNVQAGDSDSNGINVGSINLGTSTIKDATGNPAILTFTVPASSTAAICVDTLAPSVNSVTVPATGSYKAGDKLDFTVNFDEAIAVTNQNALKLNIVVGSTTTQAAVKSVGANSVTFEYTVHAEDSDTDGITVGAMIKTGAVPNAKITDLAGNEASYTLNSVGSTTQVLVDTTAPTISGLTPPTYQTYGTGQNLQFTFSFDENVSVSGSGLTLDIYVGGVTRQASYTGKSAPNKIVFSYTIQAGEVDTDGITVGVIGLVTATIKDAAGNAANVTLHLPPLTGVKVDAVSPTVSAVSVPTNKTYKTGETLSFGVNFNKNITISGSALTMDIDIGGTIRQAAKSSTSSSGITFTYTVTAGDNDSNGITIGAITLNGCTIKDDYGNSADTTLHNVVATTGVLVDTTGPAIVASTVNTNGYIDITFNEGVYGANNGITPLATSSITLIFNKNGGLATNATISAITKADGTTTASATSLSGGETTVRVFLDIVGATRNGLETIEIKPASGTAVYDALGNAMAATQTTGAKNLIDNTPRPQQQTTTTATTTTPVVQDNAVIVQVNGVVQDSVASAEVKNVDGEKVTTIVVDDKKLDEKLKKEGNNAIVTIPVNNNSDVVVGQLNGQTIKNMEEKEATLEIRTNGASYTLPASQINIDAVSDKLGENVQLQDIKVSVSIAASADDTVKIVQSTASRNNYQVVIKPVDFEITCSSGGKTVGVSKFNGYVERTVAIPDGIDPSKITTGIVLNKDGSFSHVPTSIVIIDGKYYAKIKSLTNSTYSVIYNDVKFKDVEKHWAKDSVNEVGSRLIDSGIGNGNFAPDKAINRAEFAAMIAKSLGLKATKFDNKFTDVDKNSPYYQYIYAAYEYGIIEGCGKGKFAPDALITRQDAMVMLAKAMKLAKLDTTISDEDISKQLKTFSDSSSISSYAKQSVAVCVKNGIFSGNKGKLTPKNYYTRAESAVVVLKLLKKSSLI